MKEIEQAINALHHVAYAMQQGKINDTALMRDGRLCTVGELVNEAFVALRAMQGNREAYKSADGWMFVARSNGTIEHVKTADTLMQERQAVDVENKSIEKVND